MKKAGNIIYTFGCGYFRVQAYIEGDEVLVPDDMTDVCNDEILDWYIQRRGDIFSVYYSSEKKDICVEIKNRFFVSSPEKIKLKCYEVGTRVGTIELSKDEFLSAIYYTNPSENLEFKCVNYNLVDER